jgi:hypothetical protein
LVVAKWTRAAVLCVGIASDRGDDSNRGVLGPLGSHIATFPIRVSEALTISLPNLHNTYS